MQLAFCQQLGVTPLAEYLVAADGDGVREVQGTRITDHRDTYTAVGVFHEHVLGDAACFLAEDDVCAVGVADVGVGMTCFGGEKEVLSALCFFKEIVDTVVVGDVDEVPVVETGSLEVAVGDLEPERSHKVEPCARSGTGAGDVAGVLRNLRLKKHDIQNFMIMIFQIHSLICLHMRMLFAENNLVKEVGFMTKTDSCCEKKGSSLMCIIGGMVAGVIVSAVSVVVMNNNKKSLQKKAGKVADAMEGLFDSAKEMFQ